jgi:uncharacterized membrane protein
MPDHGRPTDDVDPDDGPTRGAPVRRAGALLLGGGLVFAGVGHLSFARDEFQAQVPAWLPGDPDAVVVASGLVEIALGALLLSGWRRRVVGWLVAGFLILIFPGNIAQYVEGTDAFGLDSDSARLTRLFLQPVLIVWALWATGAFRPQRGPDGGRDVD